MSEDLQPKPDRIGDLPVPAEHGALFGHDEAFRTVIEAERAGRLHHAWLLTGIRGIGKATLATRLAASLLASEQHPLAADHPVSRQIAGTAHPGLLTLERPWDAKSKRHSTVIPVAEVRRAQPFFGMTAGGGERRICIVDAAEAMNPSAANAILKMLEEPPANGLFFLVSHTPGRLLPTIRSRCRVLSLPKLSDENVAHVVKSLTGDDPAEVGRAGGSARRALELSGSDAPALIARFDRAARAGDTRTAHGVADALAPRSSDDDARLFLELMFDELGDRVRDDGCEPAQMAVWAGVWARAKRAVDIAAEFNLDRRQLVLDLFAMLAEAHARVNRPAPHHA